MKNLAEKDMKIKQGFVKRKIKDKFLVVAVGQARKEYRNFIELNQTASLIWDYISVGKTSEEIAEEFVKEYKIDFDNALADINEIIHELQKEGIICE